MTYIYLLISAFILFVYLLFLLVDIVFSVDQFSLFVEPFLQPLHAQLAALEFEEVWAFDFFQRVVPESKEFAFQSSKFLKLFAKCDESVVGNIKERQFLQIKKLCRKFLQKVTH